MMSYVINVFVFLAVSSIGSVHNIYIRRSAKSLVGGLCDVFYVPYLIPH